MDSESPSPSVLSSLVQDLRLFLDAHGKWLSKLNQAIKYPTCVTFNPFLLGENREPFDRWEQCLKDAHFLSPSSKKQLLEQISTIRTVSAAVTEDVAWILSRATQPDRKERDLFERDKRVFGDPDQVSDKNSSARSGLVGALYSLLHTLILDVQRLDHEYVHETQREELQEQLRDRFSTDPLTSLPNRFPFEALCEDLDTLNGRNASPLTVLVLDADNFKRVNDTFGHAIGDATLKKLAEIVQARVRTIDPNAPTHRPGSGGGAQTVSQTFRWGGEELVVLVTDTLEAGTKVAERIRLAVEDAFRDGIETGGKHYNVQLTVSIGVATRKKGSSALVDDVFRRADKQTLIAKKQGRNRVCVDSQNE